MASTADSTVTVRDLGGTRAMDLGGMQFRIARNTMIRRGLDDQAKWPSPPRADRQETCSLAGCVARMYGLEVHPG